MASISDLDEFLKTAFEILTKNKKDAKPDGSSSSYAGRAKCLLCRCEKVLNSRGEKLAHLRSPQRCNRAGRLPEWVQAMLENSRDKRRSQSASHMQRKRFKAQAEAESAAGVEDEQMKVTKSTFYEPARQHLLSLGLKQRELDGEPFIIIALDPSKPVQDIHSENLVKLKGGVAVELPSSSSNEATRRLAEIAAPDLQAALPAPSSWFEDCKGASVDEPSIEAVTAKGLQAGKPMTLVNLKHLDGWSWSEAGKFARPVSDMISVQEPNLSEEGFVQWSMDYERNVKDLQANIEAVDPYSGPVRNALEMGVQPKYSAKLPFNATYRRLNLFAQDEKEYWSTYTWLLLSSAGSYTRIHHDANGLGTVVAVTEGFKIWLEFRRRDGSFGTDILTKFAKEDGLWEDADGFQAFYTILGPGTLKFMPAGQAHSVVTPTRTVTIGGHFLVPDMLETTLKVQLLEAAVGQRSTNAEHSNTLRMIQKVMSEHLDRARNLGITASWPDDFEHRMKVLYSMIVLAPWLGQEPIFNAGALTDAERGLERLAGKWRFILTDEHQGLFNEARDIYQKRVWGQTNPEMSSFLSLFEAHLSGSGLPWQLVQLGYQMMEAKLEMMAVKPSKNRKHAPQGGSRVQKLWQTLHVKELLSEGIDETP